MVRLILQRSKLVFITGYISGSTRTNESTHCKKICFEQLVRVHSRLHVQCKQIFYLVSDPVMYLGTAMAILGKAMGACSGCILYIYTSELYPTVVRCVYSWVMIVG